MSIELTDVDRAVLRLMFGHALEDREGWSPEYEANLRSLGKKLGVWDDVMELLLKVNV